MPKRIAETAPSEQISEYVGSGPFVVERDAWEPGNKAVFTKFADYKPRDEPASWMAGGKVANVDQIDWIWIPDHGVLGAVWAWFVATTVGTLVRWAALMSVMFGK